MMVHVVAFELFLGKKLTLQSLFGYLKKVQGAEFPFAGYDRMLFVDERDDYFTGLFLTVKENKKIPHFTKSPGKIHIKVADIGRNNSLFEFNLLAIHKATGRGFYYHYHHSCSVSQFCRFLRDRYEELREKKLKSLRKKEEHEAEIAAIKGERLKWEPLLKQEDFDEAVREMRRLKSFRYSLRSYIPKKPKVGFQQPLVKSQTHSYTYNPKLPKDVILADIKGMITNSRPKRGRVTGVDDEGLERVVSLIAVPSSFGEHKFDDIAQKLHAFEADEFNKTLLIDELIRIAKENHRGFSSCCSNGDLPGMRSPGISNAAN